MRARTITLICASLLIIISVITTIMITRHDVKKDSKHSINITPKLTMTPLPSVTPGPVIGPENDPGIYPTYDIVDDTPTYGYINAKGDYVINPAFTMANDFHEGYAVVYMGSQYLLIDTAGNIIYTSKNMISDFANGCSVISLKNDKKTLYGYVDGNGKEFIKPQYLYAGDFNKDHIAYAYSGDGVYIKIDQTGKILETYQLNAKYNPIDIEDGYIIYFNNKAGSYGVIDLKGNVVFKAIYSEIIYMGDNIFALKRQHNGVTTNAMPAALFKSNGVQLTKYILYDISSFHNGYASVTDSKYTYFIDTSGNPATHLPKYEGRGTLTLYGHVIKASLDRDLTYYKTDGSVIWQNVTTQKLTDKITVKQVKFKPNKYVAVYYPVLSGLSDSYVQNKINSTLKNRFVDNRAGLRERDKLSATDTFKTKLMKNLLVIEKDGYDFNFGAAHGMPIMDFYYINMNDGTFYQFKDLFKTGSDFATVINNSIKNQIIDDSSSNDSMYFQDSFKGISEKPNFMLSDHSITIYFYPYEIAPYATGFPKFAIPFEDLTDYINFDGPFWKSFH